MQSEAPQTGFEAPGAVQNEKEKPKTNELVNNRSGVIETKKKTRPVPVSARLGKNAAYQNNQYG